MSCCSGKALSNRLITTERQGTDTDFTNEADMFDVALDDAAAPGGRRDKKDRDPSGRSKAKRQKKDQKYGHGGKKRFSKSGDAASSNDLTGFSARKNKTTFSGTKKKRPGKSKRAGTR